MIPRFSRSTAGALLTRAAFLALFFALGAIPAFAGGIEGLSYSLNPSVEHIQWNKDIGLEDDVLYGGRLGLNFGRYVALRGFYFGNSDVAISAPLDAADPNADFGKMDVANYGADLALHFPHGTVLPFVYGGGGVYRLDPSDGDRVKKIGLKLGGGISFAVTQRIEAVIYAEDAMIRPESGLSIAEPDESDVGKNLKHSLAFGAGLNFFLGGYTGETAADRDFRNKFAGGLTGASWKVEPFAGKLNYDSGVNLNDTELFGVRTGIGFGPFVDLRGYYWRGVESDFGKAEQIQSYGVESQFNLNPSPGVEPHIILGVGMLDFMGGYVDANGLTREDKTVLIAGGGVSLTLADRWHVNVDARDYMFGPTDLEETNNLDKLFHSWMYTAGLTLTFGGHAGAPDAKETEAAKPPAIVPVTAVAATPVAPEKAVVESVIVEKEVLTADSMASPVRTYQGDRVVTLPVPTVGEIYIRYGEPGGVSIESKSVVEKKPARAESLAAGAAPGPEAKISLSDEEMMRKAVREAIEEEAAGARADSLKAAKAAVIVGEEQMKLIESRLMEKLDGRIKERVQEEVARQGAAAPAPRGGPPVVVVNEPGGVGGTGLAFHGGQIYTGANVDKPSQWILGGRLPLKRQGGTWPISYVPEVAFGFIDATSTLVAANLVWDLGDHFDAQGFRPYVSAGAGILFFSKKIADRDRQEGVLDLGYGFAKNYGKYNAFIEHQGIDLYSLHRVIAGIGWGM